ncbi:DNA polymerase III subunit beta [Longimycelium tulufanense]|uniref:DNA polymerase III subunit beta n=1 Tax=Longimycelium tulufanense TaxID=907463 RepID=A0A8J3CGZ4_9PSEU|nr:DNA polymerase III subunit beta [Longimycelium tulufanense]GGM76019.1 DNA polymerase III subunit beta [Longimycelium tulufanense]
MTIGLRVRVERSRLLEAADLAASITKGSIQDAPILHGVLLEATVETLRVSATNRETSARTSAPSVATSQPGRVVVSARLLALAAKELPAGDVDLAEEHGQLVVTAGRTRYCLPAMPVEDYPPLPGLPDTAGEVQAEALVEAIQRTAPLASRDYALPTLCGALIEFGSKLSVTATDRFRLGHVAVPWQPALDTTDTPGTALVPAETLTLAAKTVSGGGTIGLHYAPDADVLGIVTPTHQITTRLLDSQFVAWRNVLPTTDPMGAVTAPIIELRRAIRRVAAVTNEKLRHVTLRIRPGEITVDATGSQVGGSGQDVVDIDYDGDEMTMAYNADYLLSVLDRVDGTTVHLTMFGPTKATVLRAVADDGTPREDSLHLVMPIRPNVVAAKAA